MDMIPGLADDSITSETRVIAPDDAADMLKSARTVGRWDKRLLGTYGRDMARGAWKLNGEPIIFDDCGMLLDGRHRLQACINANAPFQTLVVSGIDSKFYETIGTLRRRTAGDVLTIRRQPFGRQLAAAFNLIWRYRNGDVLSEGGGPSTQEMLHFLSAYPELSDHEAPTGSIYVSRQVANVLPHGVGIAMHFLFSQADPQKAATFFGDMIAAKDSSELEEERRATAAEVLYAALESMKVGGGRRVRATILAYAIKAWNAHYEGNSLPFLRMLPKERFPRIEGLDNWLPDAPGIADIADGAPVDVLARSLPDLRVEAREVTPEIAAQLLANNPTNRKIANAVVARYERDMRAGNWQLNGQTIKIASSGRLLDGQHRLKACTRAGRSFPAIIVHGVDEDVFDTFDLGAKKSYHIVLAERGETHTATLAAALKWLWLREGGKLQSRVDQPTPAELDDVLNRHPEVRESLVYIKKLRPFLAPALAVACHYWSSRSDRLKANEFFDRLADGLIVDASHPAYILRQKLINQRASTRREASEVERVVWITKAWNAFAQGRPVKGLTWRKSGNAVEEIPEFA